MIASKRMDIKSGQSSPAPLRFLAKFIPGLAVIADTIGLLGIGILTYSTLVYYSFRTADTYTSAIVFNCLVATGLQYFAGLYHVESVVRPFDSFNKAIISVVTSFALMLAAAFSVKVSDDISRLWVVVFFVSSVVSLAITKSLVAYTLSLLQGRNLIERSVLLFGDRRYLDATLDYIKENKPRFLAVQGVYEFDFLHTDHSINHEQLNTKLEELIKTCRSQFIDDIIIALPLSAVSEISAVLERLRELPNNVYLGADLIGFKRDLRPAPEYFAGMPMFEMVGKPISGWDYLVKLIEDYVLATVIIVVLLPVFGLIALLIKLDGPGPILFKQKRNGFNNKTFDIYKFRSMKVHDDTEQKTLQAVRGDARITKLGAILRKTSLDELPQLFNVLNGTMSLVGPRPHAVDHNEDYAKSIRGYFGRHRMKPGLTGLAQVKGYRGLTDTLDKMENRVKYDIIYTDNWSIMLDAKILIKTVFVCLWPKNAH
jgi:putative colanic acid biosysnthesis UDP-glucose lipid carrier transferase